MSATHLAVAESRAVRLSLLVIALAFLALFLAVPLIAVFTEALRQGITPYLAALAEPETRSAIWLTL